MPGFVQRYDSLDGDEVTPPLDEGTTILNVEVVEHVLDRARLDGVADLADVVGAAVAAIELVEELLEGARHEARGEQAVVRRGRAALLHVAEGLVPHVVDPLGLGVEHVGQEVAVVVLGGRLVEQREEQASAGLEGGDHPIGIRGDLLERGGTPR